MNSITPKSSDRQMHSEVIHSFRMLISLWKFEGFTGRVRRNGKILKRLSVVFGVQSFHKCLLLDIVAFNELKSNEADSKILLYFKK